MKRHLMLVAAALLSSTVSSIVHAQRVTQMAVAVPGYQRIVLLDTMVVWTEVDADAAHAYASVKAALASLKIPVAFADSDHLFMYNASIRMSRKIAGQPMSWAMRCGYDVTGIDLAQSARMTLALAVLVDTTANGHSKVGTALTGGAQVLEGASRPPLPCVTTGALEQRILEEAQLKIVR